MSAISSSTLSDAELLILLKQDNELAFTEIYNRYWKPLYKTASNILQESETAQDITQNIFISLWQRRKEIEVVSLKPYLQQAARFGVFKIIRERQSDQAFYDRLADITVDIITDNPLLFKEQQSLLN